MEWRELVEMFGLEDQVAEFVRKLVWDLAPVKKHRFEFLGNPGGSADCTEILPHAPHVLAAYHSNVYDPLEEFCLGREGDLGEGRGQLVIVIEQKVQLLAHPYSSSVEGYWFVQPEGKEDQS